MEPGFAQGQPVCEPGHVEVCGYRARPLYYGMYSSQPPTRTFVGYEVQPGTYAHRKSGGMFPSVIFLSNPEEIVVANLRRVLHRNCKLTCGRAADLSKCFKCTATFRAGGS